jgi:hypothetical protein
LRHCLRAYVARANVMRVYVGAKMLASRCCWSTTFSSCIQVASTVPWMIFFSKSTLNIIFPYAICFIGTNSLPMVSNTQWFVFPQSKGLYMSIVQKHLFFLVRLVWSPWFIAMVCYGNCRQIETHLGAPPFHFWL